VDIFTTEKGNRYINEILEGAVAVDLPKVKKAVAAPVVAKAVDNTMSKDEWAAKDQRISRQGVIQVAVQVTGNFEEAVLLADKMLAYVNQR
jgi:hypothetical protein